MKIIYYSIASIGLLVSCKKETLPPPIDKTKPTVEITSTVPMYTMDGDEKLIESAQGATFTVNLKISDNADLKQIKYDIHDATDGHTHSRQEVSVWADSKIINISGKETTQSQSFTIPADAKLGEYHCEMVVIDASGNESMEYIVAVEVK